MSTVKPALSGHPRDFYIVWQFVKGPSMAGHIRQVTSMCRFLYCVLCGSICRGPSTAGLIRQVILMCRFYIVWQYLSGIIDDWPHWTGYFNVQVEVLASPLPLSPCIHVRVGYSTQIRTQKPGVNFEMKISRLINL